MRACMCCCRVASGGVLMAPHVHLGARCCWHGDGRPALARGVQPVAWWQLHCGRWHLLMVIMGAWVDDGCAVLSSTFVTLAQDMQQSSLQHSLACGLLSEGCVCLPLTQWRLLLLLRWVSVGCWHESSCWTPRSVWVWRSWAASSFACLRWRGAFSQSPACHLVAAPLAGQQRVKRLHSVLSSTRRVLVRWKPFKQQPECASTSAHTYTHSHNRV
ncbi:hypothetical protein COO60DRAFT_1518966, partial [Scenedesmus sp. NREL 46B-D3]